jgi:hypothetical protein
MKKRLSSSEVSTITNALHVAAERFDESVKEFEKLAAFLREGGKYPMFAPGEDGARAADALAEQFRAQAEDSRDVFDKIEGTEMSFKFDDFDEEAEESVA